MVAASTLLSTISKKIIKPFSPTPYTQRLHKLCLPGQAFTLNYIPLVFFYPKQQVETIPNGPKQLSKFLENSLSKTLTSYYPWAGRLKDNATVQCNDIGAEYLEVQVNSPMDKVLHHSNSSIKDMVTFPQGVPWGNCAVDRALAIAQLSHFECGGIAISLCLSHKVGDGCSCYWFLRDWASLTRDPNAKILVPHFVEDSIMPSPPDGPLVSPLSKKKKEGILEKMFDFSASKLSALKALVEAESGVQKPTRNEVVNALLYECAANAVRVANSSTSFQQSQLVQYTNIRGSISPSIPQTSIGNVLTVFSTPISNSEGDIRLPKVVADIRKSKHMLFNRDNIKENEWVSEILNAHRTGKETFHQRNCDVYFSTSLCMYPFQDLDFGWENPIRARLGGHSISKFFALMSTHDGGIQASVHLNEQEMSVFENDKHLLKFATPTAGQDLFLKKR